MSTGGQRPESHARRSAKPAARNAGIPDDAGRDGPVGADPRSDELPQLRRHGLRAMQQARHGNGEGPSEGFRPEEETDTSFFDTKASTKAGKGTADIVGRVDGPNRKGDLQTELMNQEKAIRTQPADPMTDLRMPKKYQKNAREYLDRLREGK